MFSCFQEEKQELKVAAEASKQEAAAAAAQRTKEERLGAELARLRRGEQLQLSMAAVLRVRGDMAQLKEAFEPAVATIARAMAGLKTLLY